MNATTLINRINETKPRSAWDKGVKKYALELSNNLKEMYGDEELPSEWSELLSAMLNGANSWRVYSIDGFSLIYDEDIAARLCTPSVLKRKRGGALQPNSKQSWLGVQATALRNASWLIGRIIRRES